MLKRIALALLLAIASLSGPAHAAPFTAHFAAVRDRIVVMRDALVPPLTKPQQKRQAVLAKLLAAIDGTSQSLADDVATARTMATAAAKPLADDPVFLGLVASLLTDLGTDVKSEIQSLSARVDALADSKSKTKAQRTLTKVETSVTAADTAASDVKAAAKALAKAAQGAVSLAAAVAKAEGGGAADCAGIPNQGLELVVTGAGGYSKTLRSAQSMTPQSIAGQTIVEYVQGQLTFSLNIQSEPAAIHTGAPPTLYLNVIDYGPPYGNWDLIPGAVQVVEESPTRVGLCIDAVLHAVAGSITPQEVRVSGYLVFTR